MSMDIADSKVKDNLADHQKEELNKAFRELSKVLAYNQDADLTEEFLKSLLTEKEVEEVASRWALVRLIDQGMSQRNISSKLGLSLCKITRGSKELKKEHSPFRRMIDLYNKRKQSGL